MAREWTQGDTGSEVTSESAAASRKMMTKCADQDKRRETRTTKIENREPETTEAGVGQKRGHRS